MKALLKSKKKIAVLIIVAVLIVALLTNIIASMFFSFAIFKKDGWKQFEEYLYGEQLENESEWIEEKSEKIQIKNADGKVLTAAPG